MKKKQGGLTCFIKKSQIFFHFISFKNHSWWWWQWFCDKLFWHLHT